MKDFLDQLRRRNVYRVGAAYAVVGWLAAQVLDLVTESFAAPDWVMRVSLLALLAGFPLALILAWAYELTPSGVKRADEVTPEEAAAGRRRHGLNRLTTAALVLALGFIAWDRLDSPPSVPADSAGLEGKTRSVAVLPFIDLSEAGDQEWLADGLTEEILNSLARLPELRVTARTSSFAFKGSDAGIADIAAQLNVAFVVEGSLRRVGDDLRITAQLIRAGDDSHLWSETYDRDAVDLFDVQRDVAENIAEALDVVLDDGLRERMFASGTRNVAAFEAYRRGLEAYARAHAFTTSSTSGSTLADANRYFETAMKLDPRYAQAAMLHSDLYAHVLMGGWGANIGLGVDEISVDAARRQLEQDFDFAIEHATYEPLRVVAEINRVIFSSSWGRLPELIERMKKMLDEDMLPPEESQWAEEMLVAAGETEYAKRFAHMRQVSDPLSPQGWLTELSALRYEGDRDAVAGRLDAIRRRFGAVSGVSAQALNSALLEHDREAAIRVLETEIDFSERYANWESLLVALKGDRAEALRLAEAAESASHTPPPDIALTYLVLGELERLNSLIRRIDAGPAGPATLSLFLLAFGQRLPFDIREAPNFRRVLQEVGTNPDTFERMTWLQEARASVANREGGSHASADGMSTP